jgi:hypothetical protein
MNAVKSTWRQLVRRRLWPVAVLLLAALAAVPVVLAREPEPPSPPVDPSEAVTSKTDDVIAEPIVAEVTPEDRARRRRVLGIRKDPFRPAPAKKAKVDEPASAPQPKAEPPAETGSGSELPPVTTGGGTPVPVGPVAPKTYYSAGTIVVRFGDATSDQLDRFAVEKLEPVPEDEMPLLIYMGLTKDGKRAKFLVDASVEVDGDGRCRPHPSSCETIELSVGETEFLDVIDPEAAEDATDEERIGAQFQLDLVDIKRAGDADVK